MDGPDLIWTVDDPVGDEHGQDGVITGSATIKTNIRDAEGRFRDDVQHAIDEAEHSTLCRDRGSECVGWYILFALRVRTMIAERGGLAKLAKIMHVSRRTASSWRPKLMDNQDWVPWLPEVPNGERNRKINDGMADMVRERVYEEYIKPKCDLVARDLMAMFREVWEATHGPHEPRTGIGLSTIHRFLRSCRLAWRRFHLRRRQIVPDGVVDTFITSMRELIATVDNDDILNMVKLVGLWKL
jgi:hypothetical protein